MDPIFIIAIGVLLAIAVIRLAKTKRSVQKQIDRGDHIRHDLEMLRKKREEE
ncbi:MULTISPECIES: hypothetical protein [Paenibacillus]|uniref:hypothetical protein n=1 Tax=Paenibacillus TaxID=44249 RepID=UPI000AB16580|nr:MULTISPECIES: hypothetical protein [Paenibacillus]